MHLSPLHIPFIKTHMPSVERVGTRTRGLGKRNRIARAGLRDRERTKEEPRGSGREYAVPTRNDVKCILNSKHRPHYERKISTLRLYDPVGGKMRTARKCKRKRPLA